MKLTQVFSPIRDDLKSVDAFVANNIKELTSKYLRGTRLPISFSPVAHLFSSKGKSLRPAMLVLAAGAVANAEVQSEAIHRAAGVVELVHSASLIHDDVIDESPRRRAVASVHGIYGIKVAILAGDILFSHSFSILSSLPGANDAVRTELFNRFSELAKEMCFGEMLEQQSAKGTDSLDEYLKIIDLKTAQLFSTSSVAGAILTGGTDEQIEAAEKFGHEFGLAYQLVDDHIDGDTIFTGKRDLLDEAAVHIFRAKECLPAISESTEIGHNLYQQSMNDLCDWMMEQA